MMNPGLWESVVICGEEEEQTVVIWQSPLLMYFYCFCVLSAIILILSSLRADIKEGVCSQDQAFLCMCLIAGLKENYPLDCSCILNVLSTLLCQPQSIEYFHFLPDVSEMNLHKLFWKPDTLSSCSAMLFDITDKNSIQKAETADFCGVWKS